MPFLGRGVAAFSAASTQPGARRRCGRSKQSARERKMTVQEQTTAPGVLPPVVPHVPNLIEARNLKRYYRRGSETVKALDGVDISIRRGEIVSILGPSGSGKTTLINLLSCLDAPTEGTRVGRGGAGG